MKLTSTINKLLSLKPIYISLGLLNLALFHWAIWRLFVFLYDGGYSKTSLNLKEVIITDLILVLFFCIPHSLLLWAKVKVKLLKFIPKALYGTFYSFHACVSILLMDKYWLGLEGSKILTQSSYQPFMHVLYILSWILMLWTMISLGLFRQNGLEEWWKGLKQKPMRYELTQTGPFLFCRHPIYVSFIAMAWTSPYLTIDRLFLALSWTIYIFIGVYFKERRLIRNKHYFQYSLQVPLFPLIPMKIDRYLTQGIWSK